MEKTVILLILLALIVSPVSAEGDLNTTISDSCPNDYEKVISMPAPNKTFSNPAAPGLYDHQLCMRGIDDVNFGSCSEPDFYLESNTTKSHFALDNVYGVNVCISGFRNKLRSSCLGNETAYMSVSSKNNAHVAWPGLYGNQMCGWLEPEEPDNTTIEMNLDSGSTVFIDDVNTLGPVRIAEYPYIARENSPYVRAIVSHDMLMAKSSSDKRMLEMTTYHNNSEYFLTFIERDHNSIEEQEEEVLERTFLDQLHPSFGERLPPDPTVKTILMRDDINFSSTIDSDPGTHTLELVKTGDNSIKIRRK